jgi:hypothetical protein
VNTLFARLELPATPVKPISPSVQVVTAWTVSERVVVFVKLPEIPVMVTVAGPAAAVLKAVSVNVLVLVAGLGLKDAVTPVGKPVADKVTLPLKSFCGVTVIVLEPPAPCAIVKLFGDAESAKLGGTTAVTVRESVAVFDKLPDWPVMVTVVVPVVALPVAVSIKMLVLIAGFRLKDAVTPVGKPVADKVTVLVKPFSGETVMVLVPLAPCAIVKLFGEAERVKFGGGTALTVSETVVVFVKLPEIPVMVTVAGPAAAVLVAVSVNVLVLVAGLGLKDAVTPIGKPVADKVTLPLKSFCGVTVIVLEPPAPCAIAKLFGDAESEKFGPEVGQLFTRLAALTLPIPEAKSQPVVVP